MGRGQLAGLHRRWRPLLAFAAIEIVVPWGLLSAAERALTSSMTGLLIATSPIIVVLVAGYLLTRRAADFTKAEPTTPRPTTRSHTAA